MHSSERPRQDDYAVEELSEVVFRLEVSQCTIIERERPRDFEIA